MFRKSGLPLAVAGFAVGALAHSLAQLDMAVAAGSIGIVGLIGTQWVRAAARQALHRRLARETAVRLERRLEQHVALIHRPHSLAGPHTPERVETPYLPVVRRSTARA